MCSLPQLLIRPDRIQSVSVRWQSLRPITIHCTFPSVYKIEREMAGSPYITVAPYTFLQTASSRGSYKIYFLKRKTQPCQASKFVGPTEGLVCSEAALESVSMYLARRRPLWLPPPSHREVCSQGHRKPCAKCLIQNHLTSQYSRRMKCVQTTVV